MADRAMYRGDTLQIVLQVVQDVATQRAYTAPVPLQLPPNSVPFDLTGYRVWFTLKRYASDPDAQAVAQLDNRALGGVTVTNAISGLVRVVASKASTVGFPDGDVQLVYDVQVEDPTATLVTTVESGTLTVSPDVTRAS